MIYAMICRNIFDPKSIYCYKRITSKTIAVSQKKLVLVNPLPPVSGRAVMTTNHLQISCTLNSALTTCFILKHNDFVVPLCLNFQGYRPLWSVTIINTIVTPAAMHQEMYYPFTFFLLLSLRQLKTHLIEVCINVVGTETHFMKRSVS